MNTPDQPRHEERAVRRAALAMVLLNGFTTPLMLSAVNTALPAIAKDLHLTAVLLSWIPMAYLMASAVCVLPFGRLADMFGRKRIFLLGTGCIVVSSIMAAFAPNGAFLIACRLLQGVSAAMVYATHVAIVSSVFPPAQRGGAIGALVSAIYFGLTCGPALGGWMIDHFGWQAAFLVHIPLACICLLIGLFRVPDEWLADTRGEFDVTGALLFATAISLMMYGVSKLPDQSSYLPIVAGIFGVWMFARLERRTAYPIFDVRLFYTNRAFAFSCIAALIMYTATFSNVVLISLYLQYLKGMSAQSAGLVMMAQPFVMAIVAPYAGRMSDHFEPRLIASIGIGVTAVGLGFLATLDTHTPLAAIVACLMLTGFGFSLFSSPNANAIMGSVDQGSYGGAAGSIATMRVLGQMWSMGVVTLMFALLIGPVQITPSNFDALGRSISMSFCVAALLCVPALLFSMVRGRMRRS